MPMGAVTAIPVRKYVLHLCKRFFVSVLFFFVIFIMYYLLFNKMETSSYNVISLYKFFEIKKVFNFKNRLLKALKHLDIKGIILLAPEGININISIKSHKYKIFLKDLKKILLGFNPEIIETQLQIISSIKNQLKEKNIIKKIDNIDLTDPNNPKIKVFKP